MGIEHVYIERKHRLRLKKEGKGLGRREGRKKKGGRKEGERSSPG